jgi:hypothetical protein
MELAEQSGRSGNSSSQGSSNVRPAGVSVVCLRVVEVVKPVDGL